MFKALNKTGIQINLLIVGVKALKHIIWYPYPNQRNNSVEHKYK